MNTTHHQCRRFLITRTIRFSLAMSLASLTVVLQFSYPTTTASALSNGLTPTPPMGCINGFER